MESHSHPEDKCPFIDVWDVVGGKWRGTLIYCLTHGPLRFNELRREAAPISQKVLTKELRALQRDGLISRVQYPEIPPRVVYSLTELGRSLTPILAMIEHWMENLPAVRQARDAYDATCSESTPNAGSKADG